MMTEIEEGASDWPQQLTTGFTICQAKIEQAALPGNYRPINLFSVLYRLWSTTRTRQLLGVLKKWLPSNITGFVPGGESPMIWELMQSRVENALNGRHSLAGTSIDLEKAFNYIGREQTFFIADLLQLPAQLTRPWKAFVQQVRRRFEIRGYVSEEVESTSGFAEGCPLSIISMLLANWAHAQYMAIYAPHVDAFIYVDNISLVSAHEQSLLQGFLATKVFYQLWGLSIDDEKTIGWATDSQTRKALQTMNFRVIQEARELGGIMTYSRKHRNRLLKNRYADLEQKWEQLKRSPAPIQ